MSSTLAGNRAANPSWTHELSPSTDDVDARERLAPHWNPGSFPSRLHLEWGQLSCDPDSIAAGGAWLQDPAFARLARLDTLDQIVFCIQDEGVDPCSRDAMLMALLIRCQNGDRLAGRVVLQVMLPKVVRLALGIVRRPDIAGDREEAYALAVAAMWQAIATYPVDRRPAKVPANLALDGLAIVQRGHTGSSRRTTAIRQWAHAGYEAQLSVLAHHDVDLEDLSGPVDAELCMLLAWGVRTGVILHADAQLLGRVYGLHTGPGELPDAPAIAAQLGVSWAALRQRCHRLARRLGKAAVAAGIQPAVPSRQALPAA